MAGPALARLGPSGVTDLIDTAQRIEAHFGPPQDIEWAYADHTLWIVQARPMTALPPPPLPLNRVQQMQFGMMAELLPVRPYPLDMTTWVTRGHGRILTRMAGELPGLTRRPGAGSCPRSAAWSTGWPRCGCGPPGGRSPRRSGWPGWRGASPADSGPRTRGSRSSSGGWSGSAASR